MIQKKILINIYCTTFSTRLKWNRVFYVIFVDTGHHNHFVFFQLQIVSLSLCVHTFLSMNAFILPLASRIFFPEKKTVTRSNLDSHRHQYLLYKWQKIGDVEMRRKTVGKIILKTYRNRYINKFTLGTLHKMDHIPKRKIGNESV